MMGRVYWGAAITVAGAMFWGCSQAGDASPAASDGGSGGTAGHGSVSTECPAGHTECGGFCVSVTTDPGGITPDNESTRR